MLKIRYKVRVIMLIIMQAITYRLLCLVTRNMDKTFKIPVCAKEFECSWIYCHLCLFNLPVSFTIWLHFSEKSSVQYFVLLE